MNDNPQKIRIVDLFFASVRSFFLEVFWNFERMQNLGCIYVLSPIIKKLYPVENQRKEILRQHLEFFNTHPYMAAPLLGIIIALEEEAAFKKDRCPEFILRIKSCMAGPFAALGDSFFWATWRPFTSVIGICLFFLNREKTFIYWVAPGLFLVFYNIVHLIVQNIGLWVGYFLKTQLIEVVSRTNCLRVIHLLRLIGLCFLGIILFVFLNNDLLVWNKKILFLGSFMVFSFLGYREWSQTKLFYGLIFGSILISYFNLI
jgi:PTS system mannose-specific IID component